MAITINHATRVIFIPQSFLTHISGDLYELDVDNFRLALKDLEDNPDEMYLPDTHRHNTEVNLSGVIYARSIEIINGYTVEFEDGHYIVRCVGANHNLADVKVSNSVSLIIGNSAGLQTVVSGSGVTPQDMVDIAIKVWEKLGPSGNSTLVSLETAASEATDANLNIQIVDGKVDGLITDITLIKKMEAGRWKIVANQMIFYDEDGTTPLKTFDLKDSLGNPSMTSIYERVPV